MPDVATTKSGILSFIINNPPHFFEKNTTTFDVQLWVDSSKINLGTYGMLPVKIIPINHSTHEYNVSMDLDSVKNIANNILKSVELEGLELIVEYNYLVTAITKIHEKRFNLNVQVLVTTLPEKEIDELDEKIIKDISNTFTINNVTEINTKELVDQNKTIIELLENILNELKKKNEYDRIKNTRPSYRF